MNTLNKYEFTGIFISIAIMVIGLSVWRFQTEVKRVFDEEAPKNDASVISVVDKKHEKDNEELSNALKDAFTSKGKLVDLVIDDVRLGKGAVVKKGDTVSVHYIGTMQDGVKFDSSYDRGEPFQFTVGDGKVIQGWEKGLIGMHVGGQRILVIPSDMAYGNRQVGVIPPNTPLVFAIELLDIK